MEGGLSNSVCVCGGGGLVCVCVCGGGGGGGGLVTVMWRLLMDSNVQKLTNTMSVNKTGVIKGRVSFTCETVILRSSPSIVYHQGGGFLSCHISKLSSGSAIVLFTIFCVHYPIFAASRG